MDCCGSADGFVCPSSVSAVASGSVIRSALPLWSWVHVLVTCGVVSFPCFSFSVVSARGVFGLGSAGPGKPSLKFSLKGALPVSVAAWSAE